MAQRDPLTGVLLDEVALSVEELARACEVEPGWVVRHVEAGVLGGGDLVQLSTYRFGSVELVRARRLLSLERAFDANEDIAALVLDLGDEIHRLRARLAVMGGE
jgi:chaperone modulatory protein CbpM